MDDPESFFQQELGITRAMVTLRLLFSSPWFKTDPAGHVIDSGYTWLEPRAQSSYENFEKILQDLRAKRHAAQLSDSLTP